MTADIHAIVAEMKRLLGKLRKHPWRYDPKAPMFVGTTHGVMVDVGGSSAMLFEIGRDKEDAHIAEFVVYARNKAATLIAALEESEKRNVELAMELAKLKTAPVVAREKEGEKITAEVMEMRLR